MYVTLIISCGRLASSAERERERVREREREREHQLNQYLSSKRECFLMLHLPAGDISLHSPLPLLLLLLQIGNGFGFSVYLFNFFFFSFIIFHHYLTSSLIFLLYSCKTAVVLLWSLAVRDGGINICTLYSKHALTDIVRLFNSQEV